MKQPILNPTTANRLHLITPGSAASYIFHGPKGSGKYRAARWLAARLNCPNGGDDKCAICRQVEAGNFADFLTLSPEDRPSISIEQVRKLLQTLNLASYRSTGVRLVVIDSADTLTVEAQNALLKSLEEPPTSTVFILISQTLEALLPTIRSRLADVYFGPVSDRQIAAELEAVYNVASLDAARLAALSGGVIGAAIERVTVPSRAEQYDELITTADQFLGNNHFSRLVAARRVADTKEPVAPLLSLLQQRVVAELMNGGDTAMGHRQMAAITAARRLSGAGVVGRVVLDRLAVELP